MLLTSDQMAVMSRLLDEALPLDEGGRRDWLNTLPSDYLPLSEALRKALFPHEMMMAGLGLLDTLPKIGSLEEPGGAASGLQAGAHVGPYQLIRPLGAGGMAEVWLAKRADGTLKRDIALKLPLSVRRDLQPRFVRERDILASLQHSNIARLYDAGFSADGQPYLALEYVAGIPLTTFCDRHHLPVRARLELFRQVLGAVQYAHAHLVIHRDLKPSNILVTEEGQVQLLDFGIAKLLSDGEAKESPLTQALGRALTPDYAAPEQIAGTAITTAADVYSLGVLLYELLTGQRPYRLKRDSRGALEEAILSSHSVAASRCGFDLAAAQARATTPRKLARTLRGDLDIIVAKALRKPPAERYATASEFGEDIARCLAGQVVLAQPERFTYAAAKFARRHQLAIGVASALIATLAVGLAATSYEATLAAAQRDATARAQLRSLTQTALAKFDNGDAPAALGIILDVLPHPGVVRDYTPEALSVFQGARTADTQLIAMTGHTAGVVAAAFGPDGARVGTASLDNTARIWDARTGRSLRVLRGHTDRVVGIAFSPDGRRVATASADKSVRVWDVATGQELLRLTGHTATVWSVAFSPDGRQMVTASRDRTARVWDATSGAPLVVLRGHTDVVHSAAYSPDGRQIVTASYDRTARLWDALSGKALRTFTGHRDLVLSAAFSPDGLRIVTASVDNTARTWQTATGQQGLLLTGHTNWVSGAAYSPDGRSIATSSYDRSVRLWDATTGLQTRKFTGHTNWIASVAFSPDGKRLLTAAHDATARTWDLAPAQQLLQFGGHESWIAVAIFSPDGRKIVSGSFDQTVRVWDGASGQQTMVLRGHTDLVNTVAYSLDGGRLVTSSNDRTARTWDAATGQPLRIFGPHSDNVTDAGFSPDGRRIITAAASEAKLWDSHSGREVLRLQGHTDGVLSASFSPDGRRIVTGSWDKTARIWDAASGHQIGVLTGHTDRLIGATFSPDGRRILTSSHDKTARIWDASTGRQLVALSGHTDTVDAATFSPNGERVVTSSEDGSARLWESATGRLIGLYTANDGPIFTATFAPDGRRIVTGGSDREIRVFNAEVAPLTAQISWAEAAQFDPPSTSERFALGLEAPAEIRRWPQASACDLAAAAPFDPQRHAPGIAQGRIQTDVALAACAPGRLKDAGRLYQHGRAQMAAANYPAARVEFEQALAAGHGAAAIDLATLLLRPAADQPATRKAIALEEQAWGQGVTVAAFDLGALYEAGVESHANGDRLAPDAARAWYWYERGAAADEPHALARLGQRAEALAATSDHNGEAAHLLDAFRYFAAAAEAARVADWPDEEWRDWRYRRASLARVLAREGRMQATAEAYEVIRDRYRSQARPLWARLVNLLNTGPGGQ